MTEKTLVLVCEGETDLYIFDALANFLSTTKVALKIVSLAPQMDATSGTYEAFGFGGVLNWCAANKARIQTLIAFKGASALFIQMDTDIAKQVNPADYALGHNARHCCQERFNQQLGVTQEPARCHYILPTENTETWLLACFDNFSALDSSCTLLNNYEQLTATEDLLIALGFPSKKGRASGVRKINKQPAKSYIRHGVKLTENLALARQRCSELERLCVLMESYAQ